MSELIHLRGDGVGVVLDTRGGGMPSVLHWGADLGPDAELVGIRALTDRQTAPATLDAAWVVTLLPTDGDGWSGRPGLQASRGGALVRHRWASTVTESTERSCTVQSVDAAAQLTVTARLEIAAGGLVWVTHRLRNDGPDPLAVDWLEATLPVPPSVTHQLTLDGRWSREKRPVVTPLPAGAVARQTRRGRPGHDAPTFVVVAEHEPDWAHGAHWAVHVAWPSDVTYRTDRMTEQLPLIGGGELLRPGEVVLDPGAEYASPATAFAWSAHGLDGVAGRFHDWLRARPTHPTNRRPFTLNTWEAVYFDHDPTRLTELAECAASVGVERFVLDDGWFLGRRDDTTSLGDWVVDPAVWPDGLRPLADTVHGLGMEFGLWFEPEMVSLDSDLARANPSWLLHDPRHLDHDAGLSWRTQFVLDLANEDAYAHLRDRMSDLVSGIGIDYIKWDHNRDLVESVHDGRPGTHAHTTAVLRLIAELKARHPGLEIESCSSGGARTDLGILAVTDRVWASDSNDPVERQDIQRWTGLLLPPELVGAHVGPTTSHSSGRTTDLSYRMATSLMGSAGLEWDILACPPDELDRIRAFGALYAELREVVHTGRTLHPTLRDPAWRATAFVTPDSSRAVAIIATVAGLEDARAERLRLPGLDPDRTYRVRVRREIGEAKAGWVLPPWWSADEVTASGRVLSEIGLQLPTLWPLQAFVLDVVADHVEGTRTTRPA